ncbi:MAG: hypothetical protein PHH51_01865 [Bacilli bacterium]|nr:hypothetical protein [Bacilli bacterium]MDD3895426.1 hypothetical protein [Bacilli bacterium]MDD4407615.1 hypothetical protein [Bacilli bacterium]
MNDWISVYKKNKKTNLYQYMYLISNILSIDNKKILGSKKRTSEILEKICEIYIDEIYLNNNKKINLSNMFIENKYIDDYKLHKEIYSVIKFFIKNNIVLDIKNNEKDIILIAVFIKLAIELDSLTNPFTNEKINIYNLATEYINLYHKIDFIYLIDQGKKNTKLLIDAIKINFVKEKKFFSILTSDNSFNKYIRINENVPYYITQYNYYIKSLENYNPKPIKNVYETSKIDEQFTFISIELAVITLVKEIAVQKDLSTFLIPVKLDFFEKDKNIKDLKSIFELKIINKKIKILINYDDINNNLLNILKRNKIDYYIYCNKNATITNFEENEKYVFSKEFIKKYQLEARNNVILETINVYMKDNDILFLKGKENKI